MSKFFLIHGYEGEPNGSWRPWLMEELRKMNIFAYSLAMKGGNKPSCTDWLEEIDLSVSKFSNDKICLVGHSLGATAILRFLEQTDSKKIENVYLVSGPIRSEKKNQHLKTFFLKQFDFNKIKKSCKKIIIIHGDDDKFVNISQAKDLSEQLQSELIIIKNGGHLNSYDGYIKLPQLLKEIKKVNKK